MIRTCFSRRWHGNGHTAAPPPRTRPATKQGEPVTDGSTKNYHDAPTYEHPMKLPEFTVQFLSKTGPHRMLRTQHLLVDLRPLREWLCFSSIFAPHTKQRSTTKNKHFSSTIDRGSHDHYFRDCLWLHLGVQQRRPVAHRCGEFWVLKAQGFLLYRLTTLIEYLSLRILPLFRRSGWTAW